MSSSLALFALFSIGCSAVASFPCSLDTAEGDPCTTVTDLIGKCNSSNACVASSLTCDANDKSCAEGPFTGKCLGSNCKYSVGPCASDSSSGGGCVVSGKVGTCSSGTCSPKDCSGDGTDCVESSFKGTCDSGGNCQHKPLIVMCLKENAACADIDGLIGQCTRNLVCTVQSTHEDCLIEGTACEQGHLQGKCTTARKCEYIAPMVRCAAENGSCTDSYGFFGKCNANPGMVTCTPTRTCIKGEACKDTANKLQGMCVHYNKCRHLPPVVKCAESGTEPCADGYGFIGKCATGSCDVKSNLPCTNGACHDGTSKLKGICATGSGTSKCRYLPPVIPCATSGSDTCVDGDGFIGTCSVGVCGKNSATCVTGHPCYDVTVANRKYAGICVDTNRCKYTPPAAPCSAKSTAACTTFANVIGVCNGKNPATCQPISCSDESSPCAKDKLKGKCNSADKCQHDPLVAPCAPTWGSGDGCTDSSKFVGKCGAWSTADSMTCALSKTCNLADACEEGSLKGICVEGNNCKYAPPAIPCVLTAAATDDCTDAAGRIGNCSVGTAGSRSCKAKNVTCDGSACSVGTFKGACVNSNKCKLIETVKVEYSVQPPEYKNPVVAQIISHDDFGAQLGKQFDKTLKNHKVTCPGEAPTVANSKTYSCSNVPGEACGLTACNDNYMERVKHDLICDPNTIQWTGTLGVCAQNCPTISTGTGSLGTGTTYNTTTGELVKGVDNGKLTCSNIFLDAQCTLKCDSKYRVQTVPTRKCDATAHTWGAAGANNVNDGVCGHAVDIPASVHVVLKDSDSHHLITTLGDDKFNKDFKNSVSVLTGVLPENVLITKITFINTASRRRLTQRSVLVDYTVQVGATDPDEDDGTHEDDGRLPVGGGLRGIP